MKTKYQSDFPERVKYMLKWKGLTNEQCAKELGISKQTFYNYMERHIDFFDAVKEGNQSIVVDLENALYKRAIGFDYFEETKERKETATGEFVMIKKVKKHVPPSETAAIFLITNKKNSEYKRNPDLHQKNDSLQSVDFNYINVNEYAIIPEIELLRHQLKFVKTKHKFPAIVGGYGSGKSQAGIARTVDILKRRKGKGVVTIGSPTYRLLTDINIPKFIEFFDKYKIPYSFQKAEMKMILTGTIKGEIWFRSMDDPNKWIGWESTDIILDEFDTLKTEKQKALWAAAIQRNRKSAEGGVNTIGITTTPEGFRYTYELVQNGTIQHIKARTDDNIYLPDDYIENFLSQFDDLRIQQARNGEFVNLNGARAYYAFNQERHTTRHDILAQFPREIHGGMDFNVDPMTAVLGYTQDGVTRYGKEYYMKDSNTYQMCDTILADFPDKRIEIRPDMTGANRKTSAAFGVTDHNILKQAGFKIAGGRSNPLERDRVNMVNWAFDKGLIVINDKMTHLINDLNQVTVNEAGALAKDKENKMLTHISDALGYDIYQEYFDKYFKWKVYQG